MKSSPTRLEALILIILLQVARVSFLSFSPSIHAVLCVNIDSVVQQFLYSLKVTETRSLSQQLFHTCFVVLELYVRRAALIS